MAATGQGSPVLQLELVSAERLVWSGEAVQVIARTAEGDLGVLPRHTPVLSLLDHGVVDILTPEGETWAAAVDEGFISVTADRVAVLSENVELSHEIDLEEARRELEEARATGENHYEAYRHLRRAEVRVRAGERAL